MRGDWIGGLVWLVVMVIFVILFLRRKRHSRMRLGPGTSGAIYDMLNEDKRNAIEIIVEERAGARDPEDKDGNLPELEDPTHASSVSKGG
jgi:hypothetical protein